MWPVWVLLWMHCLMRKRRYIRTSFDYLSPVIFFLLIHFTTVPVKFDKHEDGHYTEPFAFGKPLSLQQQVRVLFTPETRLTNLLMEQVGTKLNLKKLDHLPRKKEKGYFPFSNATAQSVLEYSEDMSPKDAIIMFEDMESDTWPTRLTYTIRMNYSFMTYQYEPEDGNDLGSHEYFGSQYEPFMRLQWAIDNSYISLLSGAAIDQKLMLQEFPYAAEHLNPRAVATCLLAALMMPLSLTLTFVFLSGRLWEHKNSGIHELVKMVGVSWEALSLSHVLDVIPNLLVYAVGGAVFFTVTGLVPNTGGVFIATALTLHFLTVIALAFVVVYVFDMTQYLELVAMSVYSGFWVLSMLTQYLNGRAVSLLCCLLPHDPLFRFWRVMSRREMFDDAITISNMWHIDASATKMQAVRVTVAEIYSFMVFQILLLSMFAWYLSRVRPGKFGQALPWNFPFSMDYWFMKPKVEAAPEEIQFAPETDQRYFEKAPAGLPVGIQINDVSKVFGKERVLHGVNMTAYKGEITVLLGQNGAGKTTLISIITGLISASSGRVSVEGMDTVKQAGEVRKMIGLCPQQNIFFPLLTVLEHVMLFAMLKGQTYAEAKASAKGLFAKLQLSDKAHAQTSALSGGMRRRAQLACALAGAARLLVLDEPTSGLDVQTRRELWDLLLSLRGEHTVLLTTHFMEEADALGDRIAALHHGVLRCHATAMFLKRAIGTGYRLSLTTIGACKESEITSAITSVVPSATVRDQGPSSISYNLPANDTDKFPQLFAALEERRSELCVDTIGVGKSTLDEVFMELCSDGKACYTEESTAIPLEPYKNVHQKMTGVELYARQFSVLLMRQWFYVTSKLFGFLFTVALLILLVWLFTAVANNNPFGVQAPPRPNDAVTMNLDLYSARPERRVLVNVPEETLEALRAGQHGVRFETVQDVAQAILEIGKKDIQEYNKYLVGIELNNTHAKALYTTTVRHAAPVALNLLTNALASRLLGRADGRTISTHNHPLTGAFVPYSESAVKMPKQPQQVMQWAANIAMILCVFLCSFATLPCAERASGARLAHQLAGAPPAVLWAAALAAHLAQALLAAALPVVACAGAVDADHTFPRPGFLLALSMVLLLGILAFLGLVYFVSTLAGQSAVSFVLPVAAFVFTLVTPIIPSSGGFYGKLVELAYYVMPPHTLTTALVKTAQMAQVNAYCDLNRDKCPALYAPAPFESTKCCGSPAGSEPWSYWTLDNYAAGWSMLLLAGQAVFYFVLTYVSELGLLERLHARVWARAAAPPRRSDSVIRAETAYVEKAIQLPKEQISDAILVHDLQKNYPGCCRKKPFFAVKGISFSVKKGECFGLLGVNGAGKTTTFKMLTADTCPTGGDVFANGHHLSDRTKYMHTLSYCPQFAGVDDFLTGRQNLALLLTLRGLRPADVDAVSRSWLEEVALSQYAEARVSTYSGGCARRLTAAAALCQAARATLLDEPTAGCDPLARRRMHRALLRARGDRALVVASHSLDEMEALCHRIGIMSGGELRALGSASALKAQHAAGYSVVFKLGAAQDVPDGASKLDEFKGELHQQFECTLQDQHQTMLSYHISDAMRYSALFAGLERLRRRHPALLHDYTVTETTLEEVFLAFAREAHEPEDV